MVARPGVFTQNLVRQWSRRRSKGTQTPAPVSETNPVQAGDIIIIYCAGLGAVTPPVASGAAAPGLGPFATDGRSGNA